MSITMNEWGKRLLSGICCMLLLIAVTGCSKPSAAAVQTRNDLTQKHLAGLTAGMERTDVIDLIGENDEALASKEDLDIYTLADGTTAILRYQDDVLQAAYIRDSDHIESALFNAFEQPASGGAESGSTGSGGAESGGANSGGAESDSAGSGATESGGSESDSAGSGTTESGGAESDSEIPGSE